jgi:hypothetical protein
MIKSIKSYEAPKVEVIAVESQGVLCASGGTETSTFNGNGGISFGTNNTGSW